MSAAPVQSTVSAPLERMVASKGGVELAVIEAGDGPRPTVVLVHGYPNTKELWQPVVAHLSDRYHVVAYDLRGMGPRAHLAVPRHMTSTGWAMT